MGRKRIPKNQRREIISISLKPTTIALIDEQISESTARSRFIERVLLEHLKTTHLGEDESNYYIISHFDCLTCETRFSSRNNLKEIYCRKCQDFVQLSKQEKVILE